MYATFFLPLVRQSSLCLRRFHIQQCAHVPLPLTFQRGRMADNVRFLACGMVVEMDFGWALVANVRDSGRINVDIVHYWRQRRWHRAWRGAKYFFCADCVKWGGYGLREDVGRRIGRVGGTMGLQINWVLSACLLVLLDGCSLYPVFVTVIIIIVVIVSAVVVNIL